MNTVLSSSEPTPPRPRAWRFGLLSLALLALMLAVGWLLMNGVYELADLHGAIEVDGERIHLGGGDPVHWLMAGVGLLVALVVVVVVVPVVVALAITVPVLIVLALLAVPLLLAALALSPILLLLWLLWKLIA
jgi:hypothetical protein